MRYTKPALTFEDQADQLLARGLIADRALLIARLREVDYYLLGQIAPRSHWQDRLEQLLTTKHPDIPIAQMGFPTNWEDCPIWRR